MKKNKNSYVKLVGLLIFTLIFSNIIVDYTFNIGIFTVLWSVFTYPFVFFFANVITKYFGYKKTLWALFLAIVVQFSWYLGYSSAIGESVDFLVIIASLVAFTVSQLVNLVLYVRLLKQKTINVVYLIGTFFLVLLIDNITFFTIMNIAYDLSLFYATTIRTVLAIIMAYIDSNYLVEKKKITKKKTKRKRS